jgi:phosphosulfolactate synthase (CoM biosynthesis protein A)
MNKSYVVRVSKNIYYHGIFNENGGINTAVRYSKESMNDNMDAAKARGWKFIEIKEDGKLVEVPYE